MTDKGVGTDAKQGPAGRGGSITMIIGPMGAGKSSTLKTRMRTEAYAGRQCVVFKWKGDTRYVGDDAAIGTHAGERLASTKGTPECAAIRVAAVASLADAAVGPSEPVIGVDEAQFFPDLDQCERWANAGKTVVVSGLDSNYMREPFPSVTNLIAKAEHVQKLQAVCIRCRAAFASFTARTVASRASVLIGAKESYAATCRACWTQPPGGSSAICGAASGRASD